MPGLLSWLAHNTTKAPVEGLHATPRADRPPVNFSFQLFHLMVAIGTALIALAVWGFYLSRRGRLEQSPITLWFLTFAVLGPQVANQAGWWAAEVGRQPWIVYQLLRTSEGLSQVVSANMIVASMVMFTVVYALLFAVFVFLLNSKIQHGPDDADLLDPYENISGALRPLKGGSS